MPKQEKWTIDSEQDGNGANKEKLTTEVISKNKI